MITLDAFLVFLTAASLPVIYLWMVSRWVEPEYRKTHPESAQSKAPARHLMPVEKAA